MMPSQCTISDSLCRIEDLLTDINQEELVGVSSMDLVIMAAMELSYLHTHSKSCYTDDEIEYIQDAGQYLQNYTARMNQDE
jgi:hypothetical protein